MEATQLPGSGLPVAPCQPRILHVPIERLRVGLRRLRGGAKSVRVQAATLAELPLRVSETNDGHFEVIDGHKRLQRWQALGLENVPVVLETPRGQVEQKASVLWANNPPRTLSAMDEARVALALKREDGLSAKAIAKLCGQKLRWVSTRLTLAQQLAEDVARRVDNGTVGVTLAHSLCALKVEQQSLVCESIERHGLKGQESLALVSAYRTVDDEQARQRLLSNPHAVVRPSGRGASPLGPLATRLEEKLGRVRDALQVIVDFSLPEDGLGPAERRRLEAEHLGVLHQLFATARGLAVEHLSEPDKETANARPARPPDNRQQQTISRPQHDSIPPTDAPDSGATANDSVFTRDAVEHPHDRREIAGQAQRSAHGAVAVNRVLSVGVRTGTFLRRCDRRCSRCFPAMPVERRGGGGASMATAGR